MSKRKARAEPAAKELRDEPRSLPAVRPPVKNVPLLLVSLVLFGLWFLFLLYTALVG